MTPNERAMGEYASAALQAPPFLDILKKLKADALRDWANTDSAAQDKREELYRDIQAIGRLENTMRALADAVLMEQRKADALRRRADRGLSKAQK